MSGMVSEDGGRVVLVTVHDLMHECLEEALVRVESEETRGRAWFHWNARPRCATSTHTITLRGDVRFDALRTAMAKYGDDLGDEEEIVCAALKSSGAALRYCSERVRGTDWALWAAWKNLGDGVTQFDAECCG